MHLPKSMHHILIIILLVMGVAVPSFEVSAQETDTADIVVQSAPDSSLAHSLLDRAISTWPWYVTRASGIIAGFLLMLMILSGAGFITGSTFQLLEPITAWATHKALGISLSIAVIIHVVALYFDSFVHFDIPSLLVPFVSDYRTTTLFGYSVGSLYVALGVIALYLIILILFTSLVWIDKKPTVWKYTHVLSYLAVFFVFVHALFLGTDISDGLLRIFWFVLFIIVTFVSIQRFIRFNTV